MVLNYSLDELHRVAESRFSSPLCQGFKGLNARFSFPYFDATKVQNISDITKYFANFFRIFLLISFGTVSTVCGLTSECLARSSALSYNGWS